MRCVCDCMCLFACVFICLFACMCIHSKHGAVSMSQQCKDMEAGCISHQLSSLCVYLSHLCVNGTEPPHVDLN